MEITINHAFNNILKYHFDGILSSEKIMDNIQEMKATLAQNRTQKFNVIWDCMDVDDYEISIREPWQKALKIAEDQLEQLIIITDSPMLENYAALMSMVTNLDIEVVNPNNVASYGLAS